MSKKKKTQIAMAIEELNGYGIDVIPCEKPRRYYVPTIMMYDRKEHCQLMSDEVKKLCKFVRVIRAHPSWSIDSHHSIPNYMNAGAIMIHHDYWQQERLEDTVNIYQKFLLDLANAGIETDRGYNYYSDLLWHMETCIWSPVIGWHPTKRTTNISWVCSNTGRYQTLVNSLISNNGYHGSYTVSGDHTFDGIVPLDRLSKLNIFT